MFPLHPSSVLTRAHPWFSNPIAFLRAFASSRAMSFLRHICELLSMPSDPQGQREQQKSALQPLIRWLAMRSSIPSALQRAI
jgi:hypothetical protein